MRHAFTIGPPDAERRLDRFLQSALNGISYSLIQRLLRQGKVRVNGSRAKGHLRLTPGDEVVVHHVQAETKRRAADAAYRGPAVEILHRDEEYLAVLKPAGVSCSEGPVPERSLPVWAAEYAAREAGPQRVRPSLCHRLDAGTTGVVLIAMTAAATTRFHAALAAKEVEKTYLVAVWGSTPDTFEIDLPLLRKTHSGRHEPKVVPGELPQAKPALTRFQRLDATAEATLLRAMPVTGRTHQIRAHLWASRWPVVGDPRYGEPARDQSAGLSLDHQMLHASRLALPGAGGPIEVRAPLPTECTEALNRLGLTSSLM